MPQWEGFAGNVGEITALKGQDSYEMAQGILVQVYRYVKPIMDKRKYRVRKLVEFLPRNPNLLGLNENRGQKISLRLRYAHNPKEFLPFESVLGTMLHELCHNKHGPHDNVFHSLLSELKTEMDDLLLKGFTGDPFYLTGRRLGGLTWGPTSLGTNNARSISRNNANTLLARRRHGCGRKLGSLVGSVPNRLPHAASPKELAFLAAKQRRPVEAPGSIPRKVRLPEKGQCDIIDLTVDDDDSGGGGGTNSSKPAPKVISEPIVILDEE